MVIAQKTISIVLADDHAIVREGLQALFAKEKDLEVVAEANDGLSALEWVEQLHPDVVILDLELPDIKGLEILRQINLRYPEICIIVLSMHAKVAYVVEAIQNGARGYVIKGSDTCELVTAIRQVMTGNRYLSLPFSEQLIKDYLEKSQSQAFDPYETLTNRERQVLHLVAHGSSSTEIAKRLKISSRTVETHRAKIMEKLSLDNFTELVRYALRKGIIPIE
jgi:two-component system, NarL family, response regulator NreC